MNKQEIKENLVQLCAEIFQNSDVDRDLIEYVDFVDDLGMDSITFITIVVEIEAHFDIEIPDDMLLLENFKCVDGIVPIIEKELSKNLEELEVEADDET